MTNYENLRFRRQFLLSPRKCDKLTNWKNVKIDSHFLYVHPDLELNRVVEGEKELVLVGYAIDPYFPDKSNLEILKKISSFQNEDEIPELLFHLSGRFVLLVKTEDNFLLFNDACGLRSVFYTYDKDVLYAASQPKLLQEVIPLERNNNFVAYYDSKFVKLTKEHWIPAGVSLFKDVFHVVPNFYLDSQLKKQVRFWPNKRIEKITLEYAAEKISLLLKNSIIAANKRFKLALSLTAGCDSRLVLSACKEIVEDIFVYTLRYRNLDDDSNDIRIPNSLSEKLGIDHNIIDCCYGDEVDKEFFEIYEQNVDIPHFNDWGKIAYGMFLNFPKDHVAIKGNCVEIARCTYHDCFKNKQISSVKRLVNEYYKKGTVPFINDRFDKWYKESICLSHYGISFYSLYYWEHRMGGWQAQSQLEWDIVQETFTPFNNREIINLMLSVDPDYRKYPKYILYVKIMRLLWPEVLKEMINPMSILERISKKIKDTLRMYGFDKLIPIIHAIKR